MTVHSKTAAALDAAKAAGRTGLVAFLPAGYPSVDECVEAVVAAGRPPCPLCGFPLDPEGHICPRLNGYHRQPAG